MIKAVAAALVDVTFMPTGGISASNVRDYLAYDRIVACGGSWMVKKDLVAAGNFEKIREMVAEAAAIVKEIRG
jgi:2-dehydro-3-deoxyphosphogluconate aldolase/(4S)-4-hydroxy-2-oxoglutarate aldolase